MKAIETASGAMQLIEGARRDLSHAEHILASDGDRLLALVAVARAAKRADDATFALLEEPPFKAASESASYTLQGYCMMNLTPTEEIS